jgi:hypothetical protein
MAIDIRVDSHYIMCMSNGEQTMLKATVIREWSEVKRNGRKVEDWSWTVTFRKDEQFIDQHYYNTAKVAKAAAHLFEIGRYSVGEYGGVKI